MKKVPFDNWTKNRQDSAIREVGFKLWKAENKDCSLDFELSFHEREVPGITKTAISEELRAHYLKCAEQQLRG